MDFENRIWKTRTCLIDISKATEEKWFKDFSIYIENDSQIQYKANRLLYSIKSDYFRKQLEEPSTNSVIIKKGKHFDLDDATMEIINDFFMYDEMDLNENNISSIFEFSIMINHEDMKKYCIIYMKNELRLENFGTIWKIAKSFNLVSVIEFLKGFIIRNFKNMCNDKKFLELDVDQLQDILSLEILPVENEEQIFWAIRSWLTFNEDRKQHLSSLISLLHLSDLSNEFMQEKIYPLYVQLGESRLYQCHLLIKWRTMQEKKSRSLPEKNSRTYSTVTGEQCLPEDFEKVIDSETFLQFTVNEVTNLLKNDNLKVENENGKLKGIVNWIRFDEKARHKHFEDLFETINWQNVSIKEIIGALEEFSCFNKNSCRKLFESLKWHLTMDKKEVISGFTITSKKSEETLLIIGGFNRQVASKVEYLNLKTNKWNLFHEFSEEYGEFKTVILDTQLLLIGGWRDGVVTDEVRSFNLCTKEVKSVSSMNKKRTYFTATEIDGKIYTCGGYNESFAALNTVEVYDPLLNIWQMLPPMNHKRAYHSAVEFDKKLYIFGGYMNSVEIFDIKKKKWKLAPSTQYSLRGCSAVLHDNLIYLIGGRDATGFIINLIQVFNPVNLKWTRSIPLPTGLYWTSAITFCDKLIVTGGWRRKRSVYEMNLTTKKWNKLNDLLYVRYNHTVLAVSSDLMK